MIKVLFIVLTTASLLFTCLHLTHYDPGTITLSIDQFTITTTLWFFAGIALAALFILLLLSRLLRFLSRLGKRDELYLQRALQAWLVTGNWQQAAKQLNRLSHKQKRPHFLALAQALETCLNPQRSVDAATLPLLSQGLLHMVRSEHTAALSIWTSPSLKIPAYLKAVLWLHTLSNQTNPSPSSLQFFYRTTQKEHKQLSRHYPEKMSALYQALLPHSEDIKILFSLWKSMPKALCQQPEIVVEMAKRLIHHGDPREAKQLLSPHWKAHPTQSLLELYLKTLITQEDKRAWLCREQKRAPASIQPHLYAHLGDLCLQEGAYQQAKEHFKQALSHPASPQSVAWQAALALCHQHLGENGPLQTTLGTLRQKLLTR